LAVVEIELRRGDDVLHQLACDPMQVTFSGANDREGSAWNWDGMMVDCFVEDLAPGPLTIRTRVVPQDSPGGPSHTPVDH
jgi:hypothetical protein